jgi:hypothetical protein
MSSLLNSLVAQLNAQDLLRDQQHASRIFVDGNFFRHPKYAFMFYVIFDYITDDDEALLTEQKRGIQLGAICKSAQLPRFTIDSQVMNAYNRKNIVQKAIKYDPVSLRFHDDSADLVREFWYDYYSFYYRDSEYSPEVYTQQHKYRNRTIDGWGYGLRPEVADPAQQLRGTNYNPLKSIRILSLMQKKFSEYMLMNPIITAFRHGEHNNEGSGLLEHEMTITYEQVKYRKGTINRDTLGDSLLLLYDNVQSPGLTGGRSIFGTGGFIETLDNISNDLANGNWSSALIKLNKTRQNFAGTKTGELLKNEGLQYIGAIAAGNQNPLSPVSAPTLGGAVSSGLTRGVGGSIYSTVAAGGLVVAGTAGMLNNDPGDPTQAEGEVRLQQFVDKNTPQDNDLPNYDFRASSNNDYVSTASPAPQSTQAGFPRLDTASSSDTGGERTLNQFSIEELTAEIAARLGLDMSDMEDLIASGSQGIPPDTPTGG